MDEMVLEKLYQEKLEERIIAYLAEKYGISFEEAMEAYYNSKLADKIHHGVEGVQYLDHKVLAQILEETEPDIISFIRRDDYDEQYRNAYTNSQRE